MSARPQAAPGTVTTPTKEEGAMGSAHIHGPQWGARVQDYASIMEGFFCPVYERVFSEAKVGAGTKLLDVGCGPGLAAQLAAERGALVAGLDAAEASVAIARERTPDGDFRSGELEALPWPHAAFDVVTSFNAFQFAADIPNALREARRVVRPRGRVAMVVWGRDEACETLATLAAVNKLLPPAQTGAVGPPLSAPGRVERLLEQAGLLPLSSGELECVFAYPDLETAVRGVMSAGAVVSAAQRVGDEIVQRAVAASFAPFQTSAGGYRQRNMFRYVIASA
ncbi:MAG: class I SAM-dependent methyltransferase [Roseiflexaceae bacterium]|nr:class I SAM-dependent methyltransferase [Roseiflexaceae bacterium]